MEKKQYELLSQMKKRYLAAHGPAEFQIASIGASASARQFYLEHLGDNLLRPMAAQHISEYSRGSGSELDDKMRALRSSSAMTFNILGNDRCVVTRDYGAIHEGAYSIEYEYQIPTLQRGLPANLDALLASNRCTIACEMKMLEWLTSAPAPLREKYLNERYYPHSDAAPVFVVVAQALEESGAFTRYDYAQMFKHSLALYNACRSGRLDAHVVTLLNCVWEPPENYELPRDVACWISQAKAEEHTGFATFREIMAPVRTLFEDSLGVKFGIAYMAASDLIGCLAYPPEELAALQRYL